MQLLLVPLDDSILFPGMTATIAAEVGDAEQVFVLPRPDGEYGRIGTVAEVVDTGRLPGGINAVTLTGLHRGRAGTASPGAQRRADDRGRTARRRRPRPTSGIRELERNYRAVVEEILELRGDDGRVAAFLRSISEPGAARRHLRLQPRHLARRQAAAARDGRRHRAARAGARAAARAAGRAPGPPADPRRRRVRRPGPAARVLPAQADGVDPQGAGRGRRLGRRGVPDARSTSRRCPRPSASRPSASSAGSSAWASRAARRR